MAQKSDTSATHYAHSKPDAPRDQWQELGVHLNNVAKLAASMMPPGSEDWGRMAGLWHDMGKFSAEFQKRIGAADDAELETRPQHVDHSTAGAQHAHVALGEIGLPIAYAIAGHHAGLANFRDSSDSNLTTRLRKSVPAWDAAPSDLLGAPSTNPPPLPFQPDPKRIGIQLFMFTRMLFSALVDADFLDTEAFYEPSAKESRITAWTLPEMKGFLDRHLSRLSSNATDAANANPYVLRSRAEVLAACRRAASLDPGLFSLTVPTGGGKTLSSLAFALDHSLQHGLRRVIYVIPYTSIIEQNAGVFRSVFGEKDGQSPVLEHHSNYEADEESRWDRLSSENWDAPLVVTTGVQFFESLFAARVGKSRRVHNIAGSVIILDEAQFLPPGLLMPTLRAIEELATSYGSTFVFCTATQPAISKNADFEQGLSGVREIVPDPQKLFSAMRRTKVQFVGDVENADIAERLRTHRQVLAVVNTRKAARQLYEETIAAGSDPQETRHLSARMYPRHRTWVLGAAAGALSEGLPIRVVSTQLIEAGVDIDFPVVYRELAGVDSIAQSAGRCNREGRTAEPGDVFVFRAADRRTPAAFRAAVDATAETQAQHGELLTPDAVETYFRNLYWRKSVSGGLDAKEILKLLDSERAARFDIPFRDIAERYEVIDSKMRPIVINPGLRPDDDSDEARALAADSGAVEELVDALSRARAGGWIMRRLQPFTVQVYEFEFKTLLKERAIDQVWDGVWVLSNPDAYDIRTGLAVEDSGVRDPKSLIG